MASVFKKDKRNKKAPWYVDYFDEHGVRQRVKGCTDRAATDQIARKLESDVELRRRGVLDPKSEAHRDHEARPLADHLSDFRRSLEAKGGSRKHALVTTNRASRVFALANAKRISEVSSSKVLDALTTLKGEGLGAETINHHIRAVKAFARWLWKDGRAREHVLAHLSTCNAEADRRRTRRALTAEEAVLLINAADGGPTVMGMTGPDRAMLYRLALATGFRSAELASLTPSSFRLESDPPTVVCEAAYTKNGHHAEQPIPDALAALLGPWVANLRPDQPVFNLTDRTAEMIRVDLEAAGIPYETASGVIDFHATRVSYVSHLVASGASVKTCQTLARHSTPSLTIGIYAKASLHDVKGAVESLPDLTAKSPSHQQVAATGTNGYSEPTATTGATLQVVEDPNIQAGQEFASGRPVDLKSSGGLPPCGFDSHRRQ